MLKHPTYITLIFFHYLMLSCTSTPEQESNISKVEPTPYEVSLISQETFKFKIDSLTKSINYISSIFEQDDDVWFTDYDENIHAIQLYHFTDKKKNKRIQLATEGPNEINDLEKYHIHTLDSIFVYSYEANTLYLINQDANIIKKWKMKDALSAEFQDFELEVPANFSFKYVPNKKVIHFKISPNTDPNQKEYFLHSIIAEFNLSENKITHHYGVYPEIYTKKGLFTPLDEVGLTLTDSIEIVYFMASPFVFLYDKTDKTHTAIVEAKSRYIPQSIKPISKFGEVPSVDRQRKYYFETSNYGKILYHHKHPFIYRVVKLPTDDKKNDGTPKANDDLEYAVMIFNKNFDFINEVLLPKNTYNMTVSLITKRGLLLSLNNSNSPKNLEDVLQLELLSPVKVDK